MISIDGSQAVRPRGFFLHSGTALSCGIYSARFGGARSRFRQLPDSCRTPPGGMRARARAISRTKRVYVQWYIDAFRSRARSKGIGHLVVPPFLRCVTSLPLPRSFREHTSLALPSLAYFVDRPLRASLRFEKLIAHPSTCPRVPSYLRAPSLRLAQELRHGLVVYHARTLY